MRVDRFPHKRRLVALSGSKRYMTHVNYGHRWAYWQGLAENKLVHYTMACEAKQLIRITLKHGRAPY